ncbi:MAG: hypothetical protein ACYCXE_05045 [Thermoleophilia bacterium]
MNPVTEIIAQVNSRGFQAERRGDKLRLIIPAGCPPPDDLIAKLKSHKEGLLDHLAAHERITPEEYEALTPEQKHFYQPATGRKQTLTWEEAGRLIEEGTTAPEPGSFEEEADALLLESSRRLARAWPKGCNLEDDPRWQQADQELHVSYRSLDISRLQAALDLREKLALKLFAAHEKEAEPNQTQYNNPSLDT